MIKQLLVIFKLVILTEQLCSIASRIPNLYTYSVTLLNTNLNALQSNYTLQDENGLGSYALAINQIDIMSPIQWNLTVSSLNSTVIVTLRNRYVNWIKISCIVWSSQREDLVIGTSVMYFANSSYTLPQEINVNRAIKNYDSSIAIAYLNGFKLDNNPLSISISVAAFKVGNCSFGVNIDNPSNLSILSISISYVVFSPFYSNFQFYGDNLKIKQQSATFYDVSQSIPNTIYKFFGFTEIKTLNGQNFKFESGIDQNYILKMVLKKVQLNLQYIYLLPRNYFCPDQCNFSIISNNNCIDKCPIGSILVNNGDISFCKICSKQLHQVPNNNNSICICQDGYSSNNTQGTCLPIENKKIILDSQANKPSSQPKNSQINQAWNPFSNNMRKQATNAKFQTAPNSASCSKPNSELINNICICKKGYVSLSNLCIAIVSLGSPFSSERTVSAVTSTMPAIKAFSACSQNQQFSINLNKCICNAGFKMNGTKCVNICSSIQSYNLITNSCICIIGHVRINGLCTICIKKNRHSLGNETCYPIQQKKYCRNNYIHSGGNCLSCSAINVSVKAKDGCSVCQNGFVYNGFNCTCPYQVINAICVNQVCGNSKIDQGQNCDDGNKVNGDGCSSNCIVEQGYSCNGVPSVCFKNICGNGKITGGEQCDDSNSQDGDGCSASCLIEATHTCVGCLLSSCFKVLTGNLTLVNVSYNTNNVYVTLQVPNNYTFKNNAFAGSFIQPFFLSKTLVSKLVFCQQSANRNDRFNCLIIFPSGVPNIGFIMLFRYNYENSQGATIVDFKSFMKNAC